MTEPHNHVSAESGDVIAALESKVDRLSAELRDAANLLRDARIAAAGISAGEIVRYKRTGKRFRVVRVEPHSFSTWIMGNPERADGTFGKAVRHLFDDWERV